MPSQGWQPKMFQLAVNYRSHSGIVNCAHSVIELIMRFWPSSIDRLAPETGVAYGHEPFFFTNQDGQSAQLLEFLFGNGKDPIEFGARQCEFQLSHFYSIFLIIVQALSCMTTQPKNSFGS
jgi:hypothetical protein